MLAIHCDRIKFGYWRRTRGRTLQVDLEDTDRMIADVFGDIGAARRTPANVAAAEFNPGQLLAFLDGHHAGVEIDQHTVGGMSVPGDRRRPRLERRDNDAR